MVTAHLTLLVPGLFASAVEHLFDDLDLKALELILSRAQRVENRFAAQSLEGMMCRAMGVRQDESDDWPIAPITCQMDGDPLSNVWYLRADPVHARAGLGDVTLVHPQELSITAEESMTLAASVNQHFREEPWRLLALHPQRWYIECDVDPG